MCQELLFVMGNSAEERMIYKLRGMGRGSIFSPSDFYDLGTRNAVASVLKRWKQEGIIRHLSRNMYDFPRQDKTLGTLEPELTAFIRALEHRENMPIYPSGAYAAHQLGLTEQVPMNPVFVALRSLSVRWGQRTIRIKKASVRTLSIKTPLHIILSQALKWLGSANISEMQLERLRSLFSDERRMQLLQDMRYMPLNQHDIIRFIANRQNS